MSDVRTDEGRGRPDPEDQAKPDSPTDLDARSVKYVLRKTLREFTADNCTDLGAALTYYAILAIFPAMVALLSIMGLFSDPQQTVDTVMGILRPLVSDSVLEPVQGVLEGLAGSGAAGFGLVIGLALALFSASGYVGAFSRAMNTIYEIEEGRPIWKLRPTMFALTLVSVLLAATALALLILSGPLLTSVGNAIGIGNTAVTVFGIVKWPLLLGVVIVLVGLLYYVSPNVEQPKFRWISVGAAVAIGTWVIASALFGFYVANFSNYSATYGSLAALPIALLYVWITNLALLFGAELDAELERGRQLQAGMPAEEELQLPPRDTAQIKKARAQHDKDVALGRRIRRSAARREQEEDH
ncbi:YihY/virulence factor BrkB family protein [Nocardioides marmoraquaticus]